MSILVLVENDQNVPRKSSLEALSLGMELATKLETNCKVITGGTDADKIGDGLKGFAPYEIIVAEDPGLNIDVPEYYFQILEAALDSIEPKILLMANSVLAKSVAPMLCAKRRAGLISDCIEVLIDDEGELSFKRPIYAGKALSLHSINTGQKIVTIRPNIFEIGMPQSTSDEVNIIKLDFSLEEPAVEVCEIEKTRSSGPALHEADVVVSGGRGLGDASGFEILERLAGLLHGAVGASRNAVDAGWRDHQAQVGQTGKVVSPNVYIAAGISGAIQHLAGIRSSRNIIAINTDADAPIFRMSDYGAVADLYEVLPEMIKQLEERNIGEGSF